MSAQALESTTFLPEDPGEALAPVLDFLEAHTARRGPAASSGYALVGVDADDRIELPESVHRALTQVVAALVAGKAVTVAPHSMTLTTQQTADILGVSRPTVVRLIDEGELPADRVGNRRRLLLKNVLDYRERRRHRQYEALAATGIDISEEEPAEVVQERLRTARKVIAERRRRGTAHA